MKIALVITGLGMGGAEQQVTALADIYASKGHTVLIVALTGEAIVLPARPEVKVHCMRMKKTPMAFVRGYWQLVKLMKQFEPDVLHSHMVHANILTRLLRLCVKVPRLINTAHNSNEGGWLRMLGYRITDFLADISTNVSQEAVDHFLKKGAVKRDRMIVVSNGIDYEQFRFSNDSRVYIREKYGIGERTNVMLAVGRLVEQKDYPNLLAAFAEIDPKQSDCVLWIAGGGPLEHRLKVLVSSLGLTDRVRFLGVRRDIPSLMSAADVFALSSAWEGFGLVVAEAMACERLVVATDAGGVREVLGDTGWLVPARDSSKLSDAMKSALSLGPAARVNAGRAARLHVEKRFSIHAIASQWLHLYTKNA